MVRARRGPAGRGDRERRADGRSGNVLTQIVKLAHEGLAAILATELRPHGVAAVAITPGSCAARRCWTLRRDRSELGEGGKKDSNFLESESPLFVGRAVAALAGDADVMKRSGHLFSSWELAREYG